MDQIFTGPDPASYALETRSVRLTGRTARVRLEAQFWLIIEEIAAAQEMAVARFLSQLHAEALARHGDVGDFAALLRCACLNYRAAEFDRARPAEEADAA